MAAIFLLTLMVAIATALPLGEDATAVSSITTEETPFRWNPELYPNPKTSYESCGRTRPSFICDPESILTPEQADRLDYLIGLIRNETFCFCSECLPDGPRGITIGIALVSRVFRKFHHEPAEAMKLFSEHLRKTWNFGTCDDDIVIGLATGDRQSYIASGERIQMAISSEQTDRIFIETKAHFQNNNYYQGLESIVQSYYDLLRKATVHHSQVNKDAEEVSQSSVGLAVGLVVGFIVLGATLGFVIVVVRRRRSSQTSKAKVSRNDSPPRPIVKKTVDFFPNTPYQPCEIDDNENDTYKVHTRGANELSMVVEERGDEEASQVSETSTQPASPEVTEEKRV